ncbi:hypothetical protein RCL1_000104 [Eukaryota sp. TZLM3-RCL]
MPFAFLQSDAYFNMIELMTMQRIGPLLFNFREINQVNLRSQSRLVANLARAYSLSFIYSNQTIYFTIVTYHDTASVPSFPNNLPPVLCRFGMSNDYPDRKNQHLKGAEQNIYSRLYRVLNYFPRAQRESFFCPVLSLKDLGCSANASSKTKTLALSVLEVVYKMRQYLY